MSVPFRQSMSIGSYLMKNRLQRKDRFAIVLELEPLFACNLACQGCGKIQHSASVLKQRMSVEDAVRAVNECGAPVVSIAGGEPLMHPQLPEIVAALVERKKYVYLCTNALLLREKLHKYTPSRYFSWMVHVDGLEERHDRSVDRDGTFEEAVAAIKAAKEAGFRVNTNTTVYSTDSADSVRGVLDFLNNDLGVDQMQISPAYAYEKAPNQEHFLGVKATTDLFSEAFSGDRRKTWRLNHSPLFLDFLEGKVDFPCTAWAIPSYSLFGWQKPCYLLGDGYAASYGELIDSTDWDAYGRGKDDRCENCMAHCGYEPSAVLATLASLKQSLRAAVS